MRVRRNRRILRRNERARATGTTDARRIAEAAGIAGARNAGASRDAGGARERTSAMVATPVVDLAASGPIDFFGAVRSDRRGAHLLRRSGVAGGRRWKSIGQNLAVDRFVGTAMGRAGGAGERGRSGFAKGWTTVSVHRSGSRGNHGFALCGDRHGLLPTGLQSTLRNLGNERKTANRKIGTGDGVGNARPARYPAIAGPGRREGKERRTGRPR